ncbi:hypothetical protein FQN55_003426 [Onygenales sp. PD_40]|nr:hypothetical protein FQN55_003426 [Onygenales sp. PD_40]
MPPWDPPSLLIRLLASPLIFFLRPLYALLRALHTPPLTRSPSHQPVRVVCLSDTHTLQLEAVPNGDILIHSGDMANLGSLDELQAAIDWLKSLPHAHKIVIAGNHDSWLDETVRPRLPSAQENADGPALDWGDIHYLQNSSVAISIPPRPNSPYSARTLNIHGVPQIPQLTASSSSLHAFQYPPDAADSPFPSPIPPDTDILVSHSPPRHHMDIFPHSLGCPHLLRAIWRIRPILHVFGHVHANRGMERAYYDPAQRAWESLCSRREEGGPLWERGGKGVLWWAFVRGAWLRDALNPAVWMDGATVLWYAAKTVVWTRVWGGDGTGLGKEGWLVNAACMGEDGKLRGGTVIDL